MKIKRFLTLSIVIAVILHIGVFASDNELQEIWLAYLDNDYPAVGTALKVNVICKKFGQTTSDYKDTISEFDAGVFYQWYRNTDSNNTGGIPIDGADGKFYIPTYEDLGNYLYCTVTGDDVHYKECITTMPSVVPVSALFEIGGAKMSTEKPSTYFESVGYLYRYGLTPTRDMITGDDLADYQWYRNKEQSNLGGEPIEGATTYKYQPTKEDFGYYLYFTAIGKGNCIGTVTSEVSDLPVCMSTEFGKYNRTSGGTSAIVFGPQLAVSSIKGIGVKGATLLTYNPKPGGMYYSGYPKFQWYRNDLPVNTGGTPIYGAFYNNYTTTDEDIGKYLYVEIKDTSILTNKKQLVSLASEIITDEVIGISATIGNEYVDRNDAVWIEANPLNVVAKVQWYRNDTAENFGGVPILGANYQTYTATDADMGKYLYCSVTPVYPFVGEIFSSGVAKVGEYNATIIFDPNGGYEANECLITNNEPFFISREWSAKREGYIFKGWSRNPKAMEPEYVVDKEEIMITEDTTLYAVWERISGGGGSPNSGLSTNDLNSPSVAPTPLSTPTVEPTPKPTKQPVKNITFNDINGHWAKKYIESAAMNGLIEGYTDGSFKPENNISIEEFMTIYARINHLENTNTQEPKPEFISSDWSLDYVSAVLNKMTDEQMEFAFGESHDATKPITRELAAYLLTFDKKDTGAAKVNFTDIFENKFKDNIELAGKLGYFIGNPDNTFAPTANITRAETAAVLTRVNKAN